MLIRIFRTHSPLVRLAGTLLLATAVTSAQTGPTAQPQQAPQTAPQVKEVLPSYEGQNVSTVELAGQPALDTEKLRPLLHIHPGDKFSQAAIDQSVAALRKTQHFQAVELEIRPDPKGVRVLFVLQPAVYFGVYEFPGAEQFAYSRMIQAADYPPRGAYTPVDVENARQGLLTLFKENGYFEAKVQPVIRIDKKNGLANVVFSTQLGPHAKFGQVVIQGASRQEAQKLTGALHSFWARLKGSAIRPGKKYKYNTIQNATLYLQDQLMKQGHLGGQVKLLGADYDPQNRRADVDFEVKTGPIVHVRIEGGHIWSWTKDNLLPVYQQVGLDPELIQEGRRNLRSHFQSKGYFNAQVTTRVEKTGDSETIVYQITKGPRHKVEEVNITGNRHLSGKELIGHVKVEEGHLFGHGKYSEKLVNDSKQNLTRIYQANGFSSVQVTPQVANQGGNIVVTFRVNEGPQDLVSSVNLKGNTVPLERLAPKGLRVVPGQPYSTKRVDEDRNEITARLLELGYLNSTVDEKAHPVAGDKHKLDVTYENRQGPQVHTASVMTLGREDTQLSLIHREASIPVGKPMREDELLASENRLYTLGIFDWAEIDPRRQITTQTQEDVVVKVHEAKRNTITYGGGFEVVNRGGSVPGGTVAVPGLPPVGLPKTFKTSEKTFWGPTGTFEFTRNNVRGRAETITIGGFAGRLAQRGNFVYMDPYFRGTKWQSNLSLSGEHNSENPIFTSRMAELQAQVQRPLNPDKTTNLFLRYSLRGTGLTRLEIPDLVPLGDRHVRLSTLSSTYLRDTRDNVLDAHKGIYESFELGITPAALGSTVSYARFMGQAAYYKDVWHGIIFANSVRLGLMQPFAGSHVPLSERFFSGGGSTLRGFPLNGAGPQRTIPACGNPADPSTCSLIRVPVGGNELFILNSELRVPVPYDFPLIGKKLGIAVFYDGGNVYPQAGFRQFADLYSNTVGIGLRYTTPVGPVRIDYGHNLNALPGIKANQLFFTIGQAF